MSIKQEEVTSPGFEDDVSLSPSSPPTNDEFHGEEKRNAVKSEVDGEDDDDDLYEDALDLDTSKADSKVWLMRLPKFLMEKWKDVENLDGKSLGKLRIKNTKVNEPSQIKLILNDDAENDDIPHEYDVSIVKQTVDSTFVFTEKDMPKQKRPKTETDSSSSSSSSSSKTASRESVGLDPSSTRGDKSMFRNNHHYNSGDANSPFTPFVRTIPKNTALAGTVCHECSVMPSLKDHNYSKVVHKRKEIQVSDPRPKVTFLENIPGVNAASFDNLKGNNSMFIRAQKKESKSGEGKATRIPRNELLDLLFKLFEEYDYWSMKGLRERTKQPEAYLKEVLDTMALLIKKGPYAMKYSLKPEFKQIRGLGGSLSAYIQQRDGGDFTNTHTGAGLPGGTSAQGERETGVATSETAGADDEVDGFDDDESNMETIF